MTFAVPQLPDFEQGLVTVQLWPPLQPVNYEKSEGNKRRHSHKLLDAQSSRWRRPAAPKPWLQLEDVQRSPCKRGIRKYRRHDIRDLERHREQRPTLSLHL